MQVELDHRYNAGGGANDLPYDHVGVHSAGKGANNSALSSAGLIPPRVWDLADGRHHLVKVRLDPRGFVMTSPGRVGGGEAQE